jgi:ankyrin repeat protein/Zn finger protein HypA/HybF involved in hydrogenase expression
MLIKQIAQAAWILFFFCTFSYAQDKQAARAELQRRDIEFSQDRFINSISQGDVATVELFLNAGMGVQTENSEGGSALWYAAGTRQLAVVNKLLERGAAPNAKDRKKRTPLMGAITGGSLPVVKRLLEVGADPNAVGSLDGATPLILAVAIADPTYEYRRGEEKAIALYLLERGANPNAADNKGTTALMEAASICDKEMLDALLAHGADVNARDKDGETALLSVVRWGYDKEAKNLQPDAVAIIQTLLVHGADANAKDSDGLTALQIAKANRAEAFLLPLLTPKLQANFVTRAGYWFYKFNRAQAWFGPAIYLLAVIVALIGLKLPAKPERQKVEEGDGLPHLAPLKCRQCAAPVPIAPDKKACPNCGTSIVVPEDYTQTLSLRATAAANLHKAEKEWRRAYFYSQPAISNLFLLLGAIWLAVSAMGLFSAFTMTRPLSLFVSTILSGLTLSVGLFVYGLYLTATRALIPPLPAIGKAIGKEEIADCRQCGAAVAFAANELVSACSYCGSEAYRVALARRARITAAEEEASTAVSVYDAMVELEERRKGAFIWVAVIGSALLLIIVATITITALLALAVALLLLYLYLKFS